MKFGGRASSLKKAISARATGKTKRVVKKAVIPRIWKRARRCRHQPITMVMYTGRYVAKKQLAIVFSHQIIQFANVF